MQMCIRDRDIVALTGLAYGVIDDNYRLIRNEMAENTLIYDENRLARGIDLWLDGTDILDVYKRQFCWNARTLWEI